MARTMARIVRAETPHTGWCTRDHRCGVDEHRSADFTADDIGGRAWLTRVRAGNQEYIEIRARIPLHSNEKASRWQLATALNLMRDLLAEVAPRLGRLSNRDQRAVGRRAA
ncbi:hypothetical protein AB0M54_26960 [Actinoplanes sp. NPDC051470]|uniref:hypothetical protein n=1 Tax=Actinoplanes sp. NPDC051470 TaxID=3157224 RepID=UPI003419F3D3